MSQGAGSDQAHCSTPAVPPECLTPPGEGRNYSDCVDETTGWLGCGPVMLWPKGMHPDDAEVQPGAEAPRETKSIEGGVTLDLLQCSQQAHPRVDSKSRDGAPRALTGRLISFLGRCSGLTSCVPCPNPACGRFPGTPGVPPGKGNLEPQTGGQGCSELRVRLSV